MDISLELKGLPCLNKVYLLTYLFTYLLTYLHNQTNTIELLYRTITVRNNRATSLLRFSTSFTSYNSFISFAFCIEHKKSKC